MNVNLPPRIFLIFFLVTATGFAQTAVPAVQYSKQGSGSTQTQDGIVSFASVSQVNGLLEQLDATSKATQGDLSKLRIERWKTDSSTKKQVQGDSESIQRNLQNALPEMTTELKNSPEDLSATFKLYRNLDALYNVMSGVVESAGAFGPKDDFQSLSNDLNGFESARKQLADRMENLSASKEQEITRLRVDLKTAQAKIAAAAPPPKKTIVDDTEPAKKPPVKKKPAAKKPATTPSTSPPTQNQPQQPKPQ
jgi:hypothetical protein